MLPSVLMVQELVSNLQLNAWKLSIHQFCRATTGKEMDVIDSKTSKRIEVQFEAFQNAAKELGLLASNPKVLEVIFSPPVQ